MSLIVDASLVVQMALRAERPKALSGQRLIAPPLLWSETTSALHELAFRGDLDAATSAEAIKVVGALGIDRVDHPELYVQAARIARQLGWAKTYDAEYVALAVLTGATLVTRDARLRRGASRLVTVVAPAEL